MIYFILKDTQVKIIEATDCELAVDISVGYTDRISNVYLAFGDPEYDDVILFVNGTSVYQFVIPPNTNVWARCVANDMEVGVHIIYKR